MRHKHGIRTGKYRSQFEARVALQLRALPFQYEAERIKIVSEKTYVPDFSLSGTIIEAKGYFDSADRTKHLLIKQQHPELNVRFVFQNAHTKLRRGSEVTYASWCDKHGFQWAHKDVPDDWLKELSPSH
jgi:hypothetical protein